MKERTPPSAPLIHSLAAVNEELIENRFSLPPRPNTVNLVHLASLLKKLLEKKYFFFNLKLILISCTQELY